MGSDNPLEGRVEVKHGNWGTICDDNWDDLDATVVCRQLNLGAHGTAVRGSYFGQGIGDILLDDVHCDGSESSIFDCKHSGIGLHNCFHRKDAGVKCSGISLFKRVSLSLFVLTLFDTL